MGTALNRRSICDESAVVGNKETSAISQQFS
jgi:hypothetical protein